MEREQTIKEILKLVKENKKKGYLKLVKINKNIKFECQKCGRCCYMAVLFTEEDLKRYHPLGWHSYSAVFGDGIRKAHKKNSSCIFLRENACEIYENRPICCRSYPFYLDPITDQLYADSSCPGMGRGEKLKTDGLDKIKECRSEHYKALNLSAKEIKILRRALIQKTWT